MNDTELALVAAYYLRKDTDGQRTARVLRNTLDQLYDGQRTGRYRWDQLHKTEKTHCGTLVEINLQREFAFSDGDDLDFKIEDIEVDCKYSQKDGGWMIPPEALGKICLLVWSSDEAAIWSLGLVRVLPNFLNKGGNRDLKSTLNSEGRNSITWLFERVALPPNILLQMDQSVVSRVTGLSSGVKRLNELFRHAQGMRVGRAVVATVARQEDYMKRVRNNGGARSFLRDEGIVILGQYKSHVEIARQLKVPAPSHGESVAVRVVPADAEGAGVARISGGLWRVATASDPVVAAPLLPGT
mgnify:CR=1 FL=1